jgi:DNA-directed RNA polymerase subunit RPC12/RpoP
MDQEFKAGQDKYGFVCLACKIKFIVDMDSKGSVSLKCPKCGGQRVLPAKLAYVPKLDEYRQI